jgi:cell surface protein SprA
MNVGALQINETKNTEFTMNLSWRRERFMNPINLFGRTIDLRNQITFRFETTFRNSRIQNRRLDSENEPEPTGGTWNLTIKPSVDYQINSQLSVRAYVEYNNNRPVLSTSFPSRYTAVGVQVRFNLSSTMAGAQLPGGGGGGQMPGGGQRGGGQMPGGGRRGQ